MESLLPAFREYGRLERLRESQGLSVEQLERWTQLKRLLANHFRPHAEAFADKQSSLRVPSRSRATFESGGELRECRMTNISRGGAFVATASPLPIGTLFELQVQADDAGELIVFDAVVTIVERGDEADSDGPGMGVRFTNLDAEQREILGRLYARAMDDALEELER